MADIAFALHLGGGLYLDSDGNIHEGTAPAGVPVYSPPFSLPVDPKSVKNALSDVAKALKDVNKDPSIVNRFEEYGLPFRLLNLLSTVGKIAGMVAPVFAVAAFAVDVLKLFGVLKEGPSPLEMLVRQRFDELEKQVKAIATLIQVKDLRNGRIAVENFSSDVKTYVGNLANTNPSPAQLENDRNTLIGLHGSHVDGISILLDVQTWLAEFDPADHNLVWGMLEPWIFTMPGDRGAPPAHASRPPKGAVAFDHRLMVPLASFAVESYLAAIRGISPEYRSTGDFRDHVRNFAVKVQNLATAMRENVLARTIYTAADFAWPVRLVPEELVWSGVLPGLGTPSISPLCGRWPVGALDLRYHDNLYFDGFLDQLWKGEFYGYGHATKRGGMDFRWTPPAVLEPAPFGTFAISNPDECAAAANEAADKAYGELLSMSGYTQLLQLATLLKHEHAAPDRSQTVQVRNRFLYRDAQPLTTVTVKSESNFLVKEMTSAAMRAPQKCQADLTIWTQPIKRARPVEYSVKLRTLRSISGGSRWQEREYSEYHSTRYVNDLANPGFLALDVFESDLELDAHELLPGTHASPREPLHAEGTLQLRADTFDWWIPVTPPFEIEVAPHITLADLRAAGATAGWPHGSTEIDLRRPPLPSPSPHMDGMRTLSEDHLAGTTASIGSRFTDLIPELTWKDGTQNWDGQHRELAQKDVSVHYELTWEADRLYLTLRNDPQDRNYVVHVVVEERLPSTGQVLHTTSAVAVNGQLTYVPQRFLDAERKALAKAQEIIQRFSDRYSESHPVGPGDPVIGWLRPADLVRPDSIARFADLARENEPELLEKVLRELEG